MCFVLAFYKTWQVCSDFHSTELRIEVTSIFLAAADEAAALVLCAVKTVVSTPALLSINLIHLAIVSFDTPL